MKNNNNNKISSVNTTPVFTNCKSTKPLDILELSDIINAIKNGDHKTQIDKIRQCEDKKKRTGLKSNLSTFIPSLLSCESRKTKASDLERNYIGADRIVLDFDDLDETSINNIREVSRTDSAYIADFLSPGGNGIKVIISVEGGGDISRHAEAWNACVEWCDSHNLPELDSSGKDVGRLCYVSFDPDANYTEREPVPLKPVKSNLVKVSNKPMITVKKPSDVNIPNIRNALQFIDPDDRKIWLDVGMALKTTNHPEVFELWDNWSKGSDKYDSDDCVRTWDSLNGTGITIGTLFFHAQRNGRVRLPVNKDLALTDLGNGERLAQSCGGDIRFCVETKTWLIWNGRYWGFNNKGEINNIAKGVVRNIYIEAQQATSDDYRKSIAAHAHSSESVRSVNAMLKMASTESGIPVSILELDNHPMLLNVRNGAVDLHTGNLLPHDKSRLLTGSLPFNCDAQAACPRWEEFLLEIFNNDAELIEYIQLCIGYCLTGSVSEQVMFFLFGKGSNGKSTFLHVLRSLLGRHCVSLPSQILSQKPDNNTSAALAKLKGARGVITNEVEEGQQMTESLVKDLTGGDKLTARELYCKSFDFMPTHKIWQYGNHKPQIRGTDDGIWRRIHMIPFTQSFTGKNKVKDLDKLLMQEIEGILAWAIQGCLKWQQSGLGMPSAVKRASDEYRKAEDVVGSFIDECVIRDINKDTKIAETYRVYKAWSVNSGYVSCSKSSFAEQMTGHKFVKQHKSTGDYWVDIRFNPLQQVL